MPQHQPADPARAYLRSLAIGQRGHLVESVRRPTQQIDTPRALRRNRNKPCPCGSGRKTKHCHGGG